MFDCVLPTRSGRNGQAFTSKGPKNLKNSKFKLDNRPIDEDCKCYVCRNFSQAYLHHLIKCKEILGSSLTTWHNIHFYITLVKEARLNILNNTYNEFEKKFLEKYYSSS